MLGRRGAATGSLLMLVLGAAGAGPAAVTHRRRQRPARARRQKAPRRHRPPRPPRRAPAHGPGVGDAAAGRPGPPSCATLHRRQWARIVAAGAWRPVPGRPVRLRASRSVRRLRRAPHRGTLVVNADVAGSVAACSAAVRRGLPDPPDGPVEATAATTPRAWPPTTPPPPTAAGRPGQRPADAVAARQRPRRRPQPVREPVDRPALRLLAAEPRYGPHRPAGRDRLARRALAGVHATGLDLAGRHDTGLPALRHRLPVAPRSLA